MNNEMAQFRTLFLQEARECLASIEAALAALKADPKASAPAAEAQRLFHTIKGNSATMGFEKPHDLARLLEEGFEAARAIGPIDGPLLALAGEGVGVLRALMKALEAGSDDAIDVLPLAARLRGRAAHPANRG